MTKCATVLHHDVLQAHGFERRGTTCSRDDFLHREVSFSAAPYLPPEERSVTVGFSVGWLGLPDDLPEFSYTVVGGQLRTAYLLPEAGTGALDPELVEAVAGPALEYVIRHTSPDAFIDWLLNYREEVNDPRMLVPYAPSVHFTAAAWGAVLLGDAERCERGLALARHDLFSRGPASAAAEKRASLGEVERSVDRTWLALHGTPRPEAH